jgi:hypothetical protein
LSHYCFQQFCSRKYSCKKCMHLICNHRSLQHCRMEPGNSVPHVRIFMDFHSSFIPLPEWVNSRFTFKSGAEFGKHNPT